MPWRETPAQLARARAEIAEMVPTPLGGRVMVTTPPAPDAPPAGGCVVLLTRPRSHRNRMWVEAARELAARGWTCARLDYPGTGDSAGATVFLNPGQPHQQVLSAALTHLERAHGQHRFVLVGACFDARTALSAFEAHAAAIDGLLFFAAPVMEIDVAVKAHADHKDWAHLWHAVRKPENWRSLVEAERWRHFATVFSRVARRSVGAPSGELPLSPSFERHFRALARSRARALFVYGEDDGELHSFRVAERTVFAALDPAARRRIETLIWPGEVHGFLSIPRQREVMDLLYRWVESLRGAAPPPEPATERAWTSA